MHDIPEAHVTAAARDGDHVRFRCLEDGHTFDQRRHPRAPLALRQSAWCAEHDAPAVGVSETPELDRAV